MANATKKTVLENGDFTLSKKDKAGNEFSVKFQSGSSLRRAREYFRIKLDEQNYQKLGYCAITGKLRNRF